MTWFGCGSGRTGAPARSGRRGDDDDVGVMMTWFGWGPGTCGHGWPVANTAFCKFEYKPDAFTDLLADWLTSRLACLTYRNCTDRLTPTDRLTVTAA